MKRSNSMVFAGIFLVSIVVLAGCPNQQPRQRQAPPPSMPLITPDQIRGLESAAKMAPKNPAGWIALGNALFDMNQCFRREGPHQIAGCTEAATAYQKALDLDPKNVNVRVDFGTSLWAAGQFEKALGEHRKALKLDPKHLNARMNAGVALIDLNRPADAIKEFEEYLRIAPNAQNAEYVRKMIEDLKAASGRR